jgi:hypothetical protein
MATERKIQGIQDKGTGVLVGSSDSQRTRRLPHSTAKLHDAMMTVGTGNRLSQHFERVGAAWRREGACQLGKVCLRQGRIERRPVLAHMGKARGFGGSP